MKLQVGNYYEIVDLGLYHQYVPLKVGDLVQLKRVCSDNMHNVANKDGASTFLHEWRFIPLFDHIKDELERDAAIKMYLKLTGWYTK